MTARSRRSLVKGVAAALALAVLSAGVCYLSAALILLASRANPTQAHVRSIFSYWRRYAHDPT